MGHEAYTKDGKRGMFPQFPNLGLLASSRASHQLSTIQLE